MDDFSKDLSLARKSRDFIINGLEERLNKNNKGETDAYLETKLRGWLRDFAVNFDSLQRQVVLYKENPEKYKLSNKELERRVLLVEELEKDLTELEIKIKTGNKPVAKNIGISFKRDGADESNATRNLSNKDLQVTQETMWKQQSETEESILATTENIYAISTGIKDELVVHDRLLSDTSQNIDHTQIRMDKTNFRMKELIYKSSDCCLITIILVLVAILVLIIIYL
jgi:hypothetical protein